jgi:hypothetical protein
MCYATGYCGDWIPVFWRNIQPAFSPPWEFKLPFYNIFTILDPKTTFWNKFENFTEWRKIGIAVEGYLRATFHCFQICDHLDGFVVIISSGHSLADSSSAYSCPDDLAIAEEATCCRNSQSDLWYSHVCRVCVTNNNGFWIGWWDLLALLYNHNQLRLAPFLIGLRVSSPLLWLTWMTTVLNEWLLEVSDESTNSRLNTLS